MNRDQKVGLALGILLVAVVAAFFFRNESSDKVEEPRLEDAEKIDHQIAEKSVTPYLTGIDDEEEKGGSVNREERVSRKSEPAMPAPDPTAWEKPDFLKEPNHKERNNDSSPSSPTVTGSYQRDESPEKFAPFSSSSSSERRQEESSVTESSGTNRAEPVPAPTPIEMGGLEENPNDPIPLPNHNSAWQVTSPDSSSSQSAQTSNSPQIHVVKKGETLSGLAARYLGRSSRFMEIFRANRDLLDDPDDLRVGMKIKIPSSDSQKQQGRSQPVSSTRRVPKQGTTTKKDQQAGTSAQQSSQNETREEEKSGRRFVPVPRSPFQPRSSQEQTSLLGGEKENLPDFTQQPPLDVMKLIEAERRYQAEQRTAEKTSPVQKN